jgi:hypothetical protein
MFASISGQHVPAFEPLRAFKFHLPVIAVARSENRDSPVPWLGMKHMLYGGDNLSLIGNVPGIVQFNDDWHKFSILASPNLPETILDTRCIGLPIGPFSGKSEAEDRYQLGDLAEKLSNFWQMTLLLGEVF